MCWPNYVARGKQGAFLIKQITIISPNCSANDNTVVPKSIKCPTCLPPAS